MVLEKEMAFQNYLLVVSQYYLLEVSQMQEVSQIQVVSQMQEVSQM